MNNINVTVRNKVASCSDDAIMVCGNNDYLITFDFDEEWNEYNLKTARFIYNGAYTDIVFEGNSVQVPLISKSTVLAVGVFAGMLRTTTPCLISCVKSIISDEGPVADPPPEVYAQIMGICEETKQIAQSVREDADNGEFDGSLTEEEKQQMVEDIVNELPVYAGRHAQNGGEVFNNYSENNAVAPHSHAEGGVTQSGGKAFRIVGMEKEKSTTKIMLNTTHGLQSGDVCTILLDKLYPEVGKIGWVGDDFIRIDTVIDAEYDSKLHEGDSEKNTLRVSTEFGDDVGDVYVGSFSHAEGRYTRSYGLAGHAEGKFTIVEGSYGHAEGFGTRAFYGAHAEGLECEAIGFYAHAEGQKTLAKGHTSHAEGEETQALADYAHAEGGHTKAEGTYAHAEGRQAQANGVSAHAEGDNTQATHLAAHAEGYFSKALNNYAHAEGAETQAKAKGSHTEGFHTVAAEDYAHAEGYKTQANKMASHAEGFESVANGNYAHAEGVRAEAAGNYSHAEGSDTWARGSISHVEGYFCESNGVVSHAEGLYSVAAGDYQHVQGKYNAIDTEGKYAHIIGNGAGPRDNQRKNIHTVDWSGNAFYAGDVECAGVIMKSPNGTRFKITVGDDGSLKTTKL